MGKKIINYFIVCTIIFCFYSCIYGAGSYAYSEVYLLNVPSAKKLINVIKEMKQNDNALNIYYRNEKGDTLSMDGMSYYYYMNYYKVDSVGYMCAINVNQNEEKMVAMLFVAIAINNGIGKNDWKSINTNQLSKEENKRYKKLFEDNVLNRIGIPWRKHKLSDYWTQNHRYDAPREAPSPTPTMRRAGS